MAGGEKRGTATDGDGKQKGVRKEKTMEDERREAEAEKERIRDGMQRSVRKEESVKEEKRRREGNEGRE